MKITLTELYKNIVNQPKFSVVRMGNVEVTAILQDVGIYEQMYTNAGFVGDEKEFVKWKNDYIRALLNCDTILDVYTCASFAICGDLITKLNLWKPTLPYLEEILPWVELINLMADADPRPISIVSYFADEMKEQSKILDKIYPNIKINNNFNFIKTNNTIKGNENGTYSSNLKNYISKIKSTDSKYYILGVGCYGLPLCNAIKDMDRTAVYMGGMIQLLFGLKGKRWDEREEICKYYNENWHYPERKPVNAEKVEGWCYGK